MIEPYRKQIPSGIIITHLSAKVTVVAPGVMRGYINQPVVDSRDERVEEESKDELK